MLDTIKKLYIEATSHCNLTCPMCSRNYWTEEKTGHMDAVVFNKAADAIPGMKDLHTVFFGGIGEPLFHPDIIQMLKKVKSFGVRTELITNGTMLSKPMIEDLIYAGLDMIWISFDGMSRHSYETIREGAEYSDVVENISLLGRLIAETKSPLKIGLSFVVMKSNIDEISHLPYFAEKYGITQVNITNLIPYIESMVEQTLFTRSLSLQLGVKNKKSAPVMNLPVIDLVEETAEPLYKLFRSFSAFKLLNEPVGRNVDYCRFVQEGNVFVRWDGEICPCMALLHESRTYLYNYERKMKAATFGNILDKSLHDIWNSGKYSAFRERVKNFEFSPCVYCGGCSDLDENAADCFGNPFPVCGGCLWAQGFIQCP